MRWVIELSEYEIKYQPKLAMKGQVMVKEEKIGEISPIYRVSAGGDTTNGGDKSAGRYFSKNRQKIDNKSPIYRRHRKNRRFIADFLAIF